jgi:hypothetical protein
MLMTPREQFDMISNLVDKYGKEMFSFNENIRLPFQKEMDDQKVIDAYAGIMKDIDTLRNKKRSDVEDMEIEMLLSIHHAFEALKKKRDMVDKWDLSDPNKTQEFVDLLNRKHLTVPSLKPSPPKGGSRTYTKTTRTHQDKRGVSRRIYTCNGHDYVKRKGKDKRMRYHKIR